MYVAHCVKFLWKKKIGGSLFDVFQEKHMNSKLWLPVAKMPQLTTHCHNIFSLPLFLSLSHQVGAIEAQKPTISDNDCNKISATNFW